MNDWMRAMLEQEKKNAEYRAKNMRKLCGYHKSGYFEGKNLIVTMEEGGDMIDYHELGQVLRAYCL